MATTAWQAVRAGPARFLLSLWPLRALAYLVSGAAVGIVTLFWLPVAAVAGALVLTPPATRPLAAVERRRLALMGRPLPDPHRTPDRSGLVPLRRLRCAEAVTRRELAYAGLHATGLLAVDLVATLAVVAPVVHLAAAVSTPGEDLGAAAVLVLPFVVGTCVATAVAIGHSEIARFLLGPGAEKSVHTLTRSRARLIDSFEVERRRIERDLHDGAQQRLVALAMTLGMAELERHDPEAAHALVVQAGEQARSALAELRELIRGIHPRALSDLGLPAAVEELAEGCGLPLTITLDLPDRLAPSVESTAYFVVAEALTNVVRHARATRVWVSGTTVGRTLVIDVRDDGIGGAVAADGTGLTGLADRVDAHGGTLTVSSPLGGPTVLRLELPCSA